MAAKKKKAAKKAVKKTAKKALKKKRKQPETLRLRQMAPSLTVNDAEKSVQWYTHVLGFVLKDRWEMDGKFLGGELRAGRITLMIGQDDFKKGRDRAKGVGVRHYCRTAQDIDLLAKSIKERGGVLDHEPEDQPWGERDFGITDPDGYKITISTMRS